MSVNSCSHLDSVPEALECYNVVLGYYVTCIAKRASERKAVDAYCRICNSAHKKLHACLECAFFGCFDFEDGKNSHMEDHSKRYRHYFAININHGSLFCFKCNDYIYNEIYDDSLTEFNLEARKMNVIRTYMPWKPKAREIAALPNPVVKIADDSYFGLRGIVNIGNSCYINCIVQVLMHTPVLVNFFFSDAHICSAKDSCLLCELFHMFQEFYSGKSIPYDPSERFFFTLQKFCKQPLGMEQQDCYELLQEILIGLHANCPKKDRADCNCMIQQIFYGMTQGFKECQHCNDSSSLPPDYFMDILLDLDRDDDSLVNVLSRKYLEPHLLSDYKCSNCQQTDTTYLHQHIKKLPTVICFRMNCFLLESDQKASARPKNRKIQKKSTAFTFEEYINMSPYLNSEANGNASSSDILEDRYRLFAVIFHKGTLQGGHYAAYIRHRLNRWYECDDRFIYKRSLEQVLQCEPFLLFYQRLYCCLKSKFFPLLHEIFNHAVFSHC
ncbi:ubiquitin carboxyl-terminal hydrolase 22-like [Argiope bruennichi]|uniref:ubiquitin carboxyl-terminal hydrolase 22-like n=1 Tax=Argiope bruennichi TaxID=94029 RepID=UPI002494A687|nr:ubiquitin carboxyl-terminal hydrolase 22-like [Argiope bruennichi]